MAVDTEFYVLNHIEHSVISSLPIGEQSDFIPLGQWTFGNLFHHGSETIQNVGRLG